MSTKHTPGPWTARGVADPGPGMHIYAGRTCIATCHYGGSDTPKDHDEARVNARLIAAAPDLLAALEEIVQAMADYQMNVDEPPPHRHCQMMDAARAAIARAKGEA